MSGYMSCMGVCITCGTFFSFNPERVPSIRVSRVNNSWQLDPKGKREPICRDCMERSNKIRRERGIAEVPILSGAYDAEEV